MDASILEIISRPFFKLWQEASLFDQEMLFYLFGSNCVFRTRSNFHALVVK